MIEHARFYLPRDDKAFDANLAELSAQGWELVSFIGDWHRLPQYHFREDGHLEQIEAIFRRVSGAKFVNPSDLHDETRGCADQGCVRVIPQDKTDANP